MSAVGISGLQAGEDVKSRISSTELPAQTLMKYLAYRGEHGPEETLLVTRYGSLTFSSVEAARIYAICPNDISDLPAAPRIVHAQIHIANPFINTPNDPFVEMQVIIDAFGLAAAKQIALKHAQWFESTSHWMETYHPTFGSVAKLIDQQPEALSDLFCQAYPLLDDPQFVALMRQHGFDGAIHAGSGVGSDWPEYRVLGLSQVEVLSIEWFNEAPGRRPRPCAA